MAPPEPILTAAVEGRPDAVLAETETLSLLRGIGLFAELGDELLSPVAASATATHLRAGEWLFREGEVGDAVYVVCSGRVEIVHEATSERVRLLGRGAAVGELALITQSPRSASVRAVRDTHLLRISAESFDMLLETSPRFSVGLVRTIGGQLQASRGNDTEETLVPAVIVMTPLHPGAPVSDVAELLRDALALHGPVEVLRQPSRSDVFDDVAEAARLDRMERDCDHVILVDEAGSRLGYQSEWQSFCFRQADRVLGVTTGTAMPRSDSARGVAGCDLVVVGTRRAGAVGAWLTALDARAVHLLDGVSDTKGASRLARRTAGRAVGLVLAGGGARGFAHIGVVDVLRGAGIVVDRLAGCSAGAALGLAMANGWDTTACAESGRRNFVDQNPFGDRALPISSLSRGQRVEVSLRNEFGDTRIEELETAFFCTSVDLLTAEVVVHDRGDAVDAVVASMALPAICPPRRIDGRLLVDGGILDNFPTGRMRRDGAGPVVGIDVGSRDGAWTWRGPGRLTRLARAIPHLMPPGDLPRITEVVARSIGVTARKSAAEGRESADVIIDVDCGDITVLAMDRIDDAIELGRRTAEQALATDPALAALASG